MSDEEGLSGEDDARLLARAAMGDGDAFESLVVRHRAAVYRYARSLADQPGEAEDVLQETFLAAWRGAGGFAGRSSVRTWLLVIARNRALRSRERAAARPEDGGESLVELGVRAGFGSEDPERIALGAERREVLGEALASLGPEDREIIVLRDLEAIPGEECAEALGLTVPAMKSRLHRARLRLVAAVHRAVGGGGGW